MSWRSGIRIHLLLACFVILWLGHVNAQDPFGDVLGSNSQLWKSFQEEMRTLEQAAHKVNTLLSNAKHQEDQEAKAAESPVDVTVLASPNVMKNGILAKTEDTKTEKPDQDDKSEVGPTEVTKQPSYPHGLNFGSLIHSLGLFKNFPEPWWRGKHVCVEKSEKVEEKNSSLKEENEHVLIMGTGTFEHCKQTSGKYVCTTVISTPQSTKTVSTTYQCCEGFRRQAEGCVQGKDTTPIAPDPESTDHDAVTWSHLKSINVGKSVEDSSFSSQSAEGNGRPSWLRHYLGGSGFNGWM